MQRAPRRFHEQRLSTASLFILGAKHGRRKYENGDARKVAFYLLHNSPFSLRSRKPDCDVKPTLSRVSNIRDFADQPVESRGANPVIRLPNNDASRIDCAEVIAVCVGQCPQGPVSRTISGGNPASSNCNAKTTRDRRNPNLPERCGLGGVQINWLGLFKILVRGIDRAAIPTPFVHVRPQPRRPLQANATAAAPPNLVTHKWIR